MERDRNLVIDLIEHHGPGYFVFPTALSKLLADNSTTKIHSSDPAPRSRHDWNTERGVSVN